MNAAIPFERRARLHSETASAVPELRLRQRIEDSLREALRADADVLIPLLARALEAHMALGGTTPEPHRQRRDDSLDQVQMLISLELYRPGREAGCAQAA
ncbi:hypothetical protein [Vulcaniibacterium tengchongense]|uniref:Uncharacterized protein n=1 Tax=Vulcaniibacterium tengchongense TaxID=1273429 RepID=A0A3N4VEY4_9GAMM|nr:hypothetical protein [Vulcaniibacterium tengchongense]RPE81576.1 hypothetical protein EDC50_0767 [Vulcaniibacterium tengchongense]